MCVGRGGAHSWALLLAGAAGAEPGTLPAGAEPPTLPSGAAGAEPGTLPAGAAGAEPGTLPAVAEPGTLPAGAEPPTLPSGAAGAEPGTLPAVAEPGTLPAGAEPPTLPSGAAGAEPGTLPAVAEPGTLPAGAEPPTLPSGAAGAEPGTLPAGAAGAEPGTLPAVAEPGTLPAGAEPPTLPSGAAGAEPGTLPAGAAGAEPGTLPAGAAGAEPGTLPAGAAGAEPGTLPAGAAGAEPGTLPAGAAGAEPGTLPAGAAGAEPGTLPAGAAGAEPGTLPAGAAGAEPGTLPAGAAGAEPGTLPAGAAGAEPGTLPAGAAGAEPGTLPAGAAGAEPGTLPAGAAGAEPGTLPAGAAGAEAPALRWQHERCRYIGRNVSTTRGFATEYVYEDSYEVEGNTIQINQLSHRSDLSMNCHGANVLESPALPRAASPLDVTTVELHGCPPPAGPLARTLAALGVRYCSPPASRCWLKLDRLPAAPPLAAKHFTGLEYLYSLYISAETRASPELGFLAALGNLHYLSVTNVTLSARELDAPRLQLFDVSLRHTGVARLPAAIHASARMFHLTVYSEAPLDAEAVPPYLFDLHLHSPATTLRLDSVFELENLSLSNWVERSPAPLVRCDGLRALHLKTPAMRSLPAGWLQNCTRLEELVIEGARHLTALPPTLCSSTSPLKRLAFKGGVLESLPSKLRDTWPRLNSVELDGNRLHTFSTIQWLIMGVTKLNLSSNDLDSEVLTFHPRNFGGAVRTIIMPYIEQLTELEVADNPRISGDVCNDSGYSGLRDATNLARLVLTGTGVTRVCRDWRELMPRLRLLELSGTNVTTLTFEDLQFNRTVKAEVRLLGAPVAAVRVTQEDFHRAALVPASSADVLLDAELPCDCRMYWARRALDPSLRALDAIRQLRCAGGGLLRDVPLEDMVCARPEECAAAGLPPACACAVWARDDPDHDPRLVRVRCEHAALTRVPRPRARNDSTERLYELQLAHNNIADLHAVDLQHNIKGLDLRNNSLRIVDEETAAEFGAVGGALWLAGNPLECGCSAGPLLRALHSRVGDSDLKTITCPDGSMLHRVSTADCPQPVALGSWLAGVFAALLTVAVAIIVFLSSRSRRFFALAVLHRWGCAWRAAEPQEDAGRRYDAFVTFSHVDSGVVRELMARLEPPYRLCVHQRDWIPGQYIAEQVVESVRESRRTLALVSRHFLASKWARAEFREAHTAAMLDARPRLLVVLLEEPAELPLDEQLERYLATNTYVRWGDPWFWDKLKLALPAPRPAAPAPRPAAPEPPGAAASSSAAVAC